MALVLLIRHGETTATASRLIGTAEGYPLSDEGRAQAERLAERLDAVPVAAVYSSPLERAVQTAEAIAARRRLEVSVVPALREVEYGAWTGRSYRQLRRTALWGRVQQMPSSVRFPGGERLAEAQRRTVDVLEELAGRHSGRVLTVVSHADIVRLALAHYAGVHLDLFQRLLVSPASVTAVELGDGAPRILRVNDTGTLDDLVPQRAPPSRRRGRPS